ncbi:MAG: hypothetical protein JO289_02195 [Xanthobacteraceae bacterium]|nr:hypothetical protein [Xanthobacteraceae bacterium]
MAPKLGKSLRSTMRNHADNGSLACGFSSQNSRKARREITRILRMILSQNEICKNLVTYQANSKISKMSSGALIRRGLVRMLPCSNETLATQKNTRDRPQDRLHEGNLHAELGQIVAGRRPGREQDAETILLWHRGLSITDIALGHAIWTKANKLGIGQTLPFA